MRLSPRHVPLICVALALATVWQEATVSAQPREQSRELSSSSSRAGAVDDEDLWNALTPLDRQILKFVNESQLDELLSGAHPSEIYLSNGETLDVLADRTQLASSRNLVFAPIRACRLFDTRVTAEGALLSGETRGFHVRATELGYAEQGGAPEGCDLPGLAGMTLKTNTVRAVALNVLTVDVGGPGSLAIWPANRSEPEIGSVSFASALSGGGVTGGVLVPICDEAGLNPCNTGDLKIKAKMAGAHVVADVIGYFHAPSSVDASSLPTDRKEPSRRSEGDEKPAAVQRSTDAESAVPQRTEAPRSPQVANQPALPAGMSLAPLQRIGDVPHTQLPLGEPILDERGLPPTVPYPSGIKGVLATGHAYGAAVHAVMQEGDGSSGAAFGAQAVKAHVIGTGEGVRAVALQGRAIYGQTESGYAVYGFDGGFEANRGYAGYFYSTNGIGVYSYSGANRTHPNILAPALYGQSNQGVGVYGRGDTSNSYSFFNEGGYFEGGNGLYARGTDSSGEQGYGARIYSNNYRGLYVQGSSSWYSAYFAGAGGIHVVGGVTQGSSAATSLATNVGTQPIQPGDLVAMAGMTEAANGRPALLGVTKINASNTNALIGVASQAFATKLINEPDAEEYLDFSPTSGSALPNGVLSIITDGLAPAVRLQSLSQASTWQIGDRLELSQNGAMARFGLATDAASVGRVAAAPDPAKGTVAIFLSIH